MLTAERPLPRNLVEQLSQRLGERILEGSYRPNQFLPDEDSLSAEFSVSRTVVREAVRLLVAKGMLEVRPRTGTRVLESQRWQLLDRDVLQWHQSIEVDGSRLAQLMELRQSVEPDAARYAATRRTEADIAAIRDALVLMEATSHRNREYVVADARFHTAVLRAAHNQYLDALESAIFAGLLLSIRVTNPNPEQNERSLPLHAEIADAVVSGDPQRSYEAMKTHLADAATRLAAALA